MSVLMYHMFQLNHNNYCHNTSLQSYSNFPSHSSNKLLQHRSMQCHHNTTLHFHNTLLHSKLHRLCNSKDHKFLDIQWDSRKLQCRVGDQQGNMCLQDYRAHSILYHPDSMWSQNTFKANFHSNFGIIGKSWQR